MKNNDFRNFAVNHLGMNGLALDQYSNSITSSYISPPSLRNASLMWLKWTFSHV